MFNGVIKKRSAIEKISNKPVQVKIGREGDHQTLDLHEPYMADFIEFLETAIASCTEEYAKNFLAIQKTLKDGKVGVGDFKMLRPAFGPICGFIATCGDRRDLGPWVEQHITVAQFIECVNKMLYLVSVDELYANFSEALARVNEAKKKTTK